MYKADFPFFTAHPDLVYLDSAATTQKPSAVIDRINHYYREECAPVGRSLYNLGVEATGLVEKVRQKAAQFIDAPSESHIIFTSGATDALNLLAQGLVTQLQVGDEIILAESEHHSNLVPWQQLAKTTGIRLLFISSHKNGQIDLEQLGECLSEKTRVLSLSLISNVFGTILPVDEVNSLLNRQGSRPIFILDASQATGHIPLSVKNLGCDALVLASHKMYGPSGVGVLWGRASLLERLTPYRTGGGMIDRVTLPESSWSTLPMRLEPGSPNTEGIVGFGAALDYLKNIGMDTVREHTSTLHEALRKDVQSIPGISQVGEPDPTSGILSVVHQSIHPHDLAQFLADQQICVRAGHQCAQPLHSARQLTGSLRASLGLYNDQTDVALFGKALGDAVTFFTNV